MGVAGSPFDATGRLAWGILGTGRIAGTFATALASARRGYLLAVGSRSAESARAFADRHGAKRAYGSYDELLADPDVASVTPDYRVYAFADSLPTGVRRSEAYRSPVAQVGTGLNPVDVRPLASFD